MPSTSLRVVETTSRNTTENSMYPCTTGSVACEWASNPSIPVGIRFTFTSCSLHPSAKRNSVLPLYLWSSRTRPSALPNLLRWCSLVYIDYGLAFRFRREAWKYSCWPSLRRERQRFSRLKRCVSTDFVARGPERKTSMAKVPYHNSLSPLGYWQ